MMDGGPNSIRRYYVCCQGGSWKVVADGHQLARFASKGDAIIQAIDWAQIDGANGSPTQVLVEAQVNEFTVRWTYGSDPYPTNVWDRA
jgi:hypothetical protein